MKKINCLPRYGDWRSERALLGLLESIDPTRVSVDLFLLRHEGELKKTANTFSIHWYSASRMPWHKRLKAALEKPIHRLIKEYRGNEQK